jgi:aspartyl protease family protein
MFRAILLVVMAGLGIGLMWPPHKPAAPRAADPAAAEVILDRGSTGHFFTDARVNDKATIHFIVDTGATNVALTMADARALGLNLDPASFEVVGEGVSGPVRGQEVTLDSIDIDGKRMENVDAVVLEGSGMSLLGQSALAKIDRVEISGDTMILH